MSTAAATAPLSPGVGARRKGGPKAIPRLPLSAFTPPNSGTGEKFPLPPSPGTVHPDAVVDAAVTLSSTSALASWVPTNGANLEKRLAGAVLQLESLDAVPTTSIPVLAISVPLPADLTSLPSSSVPLAYRIVFNGTKDASLTESLKKLYSSGALPTLEIDVQTAQLDDAEWEALEAFVVEILDAVPEGGPKPNIILSNILPPPRSLEIKTVKLLTHPVYLSYQTHTATLSLMTSVHVKYTPPAWGNVPSPDSDETSDQKEWKRRIKMYLGPIVEAFGTDRILYASANANPADWYELARESVAELGLEQEAIDAIFGGNAKNVFNPPPPEESA